MGEGLLGSYSFPLGQHRGYANFMSRDDDHRAPKLWANYEKLAAVKATYDPDNFFHINQFRRTGVDQQGFREVQ